MKSQSLTKDLKEEGDDEERTQALRWSSQDARMASSNSSRPAALVTAVAAVWDGGLSQELIILSNYTPLGHTMRERGIRLPLTDF